MTLSFSKLLVAGAAVYACTPAVQVDARFTAMEALERSGRSLMTSPLYRWMRFHYPSDGGAVFVLPQ